MILKWLDTANNWRLMDNVTNITYRDRNTVEEADKVVKSLDGQEANIHIHADYNHWDHKASYPFISAYIGDDYRHFIVDAQERYLFVLSDEGKTIDRF